MSRESDFATRMTGDATLMAILTGGVHRYEVTGQDGITRDATPSAFDANGYLRPCALVKQRANVADGWVDDEEAQFDSAIQIVEIWFYEDSGYTNIDAAAARCYTLFKGYAFADSFPVRLANVMDRQRDNGALHGASMARQDWQVNSVIGE
jgi:hypothetical protein